MVSTKRRTDYGLEQPVGKRGCDNRELAVRLLVLQTKWLKKCTSIEEVNEQVALEQFLNTFPIEK